MSEYLRVGESWVFWRKYGAEINAVDESLVTPVLNALGGSVIGPKWLSDGNFYRCSINGKEFEFVFDMRDDESSIVEVDLFRLEGGQRSAVAKIPVQIPCEDWVPLQKHLEVLL